MHIVDIVDTHEVGKDIYGHRAVTLVHASLEASASVAIACCSGSGTQTSFTSTHSTFIPQGFAASPSVGLD